MADEVPPDAPPTPPPVPPPAVPVVAPVVPVSPAESGEELDEERGILEGIVPRKSKRDSATTALGKFVTGRIFVKPNVRESELLHHRAKIAFCDAAALAVPLMFNELGKKKPNPVILNGAQWVLSKSGIAVDSLPVSRDDREKQMADDREAASMTNEELMQRQAARLQAMNASQAKKEE